ncbi:MAG: RHS repeat-associated core domain-containing protein [Armatimonadetes bacterium]|nr:RHS repeat-associated core domain-containing protein [Armatimonadota bacterium]MBX3107629.1 RHS repeat-associated core domain-containing protein [Fimbriimonadaceae bacterium]
MGSWSSRFAYAGGFGYQQDPDTGLKLLGHRYYDSSTSRFLTRDPAKDGRNWYGYCAGNPVGKVDCDGQKVVVLHYGYALITKAGEFLKWGITKNPLTRYTKKFLEEHGAAEVKLITCHEDRSVVAQ